MEKISFCRDCLADIEYGHKRCDFCRSPRTIHHREIQNLSIAHIDCDSFFAAVEKRDNPEIQNQPVIVGGSERGVVSTCCYIARAYGITSAMPIFKAKNLCPNAIFLPPRHERYQEVSGELRTLLNKLTPKIHFVSIDEGYLDLSGTQTLHGLIPAKSIAKTILEIEKKIKITVSIGLSYNKLLAKLASTNSKPRGFSVIGREDTDEFLSHLPVGKVNGVGRKLTQKLHQEGIFTLGDISRKSKKDLILRFGESILLLYDLIEKKSSSLIDIGLKKKSISTESTFKESLTERKDMKKFLWRAAVKISDNAKNEKVYGKTIQLKLKKDNFKTLTRSLTLSIGTNLANQIYTSATLLLEKELNQAPFRLIGLSLENFEQLPAYSSSSDLFSNHNKKLEDATDKIRKKYGHTSIFPGLLMNK